MSQYRIVAALGSSFAAGPGIQPVADPAAMRSSRNYAHLLADRLGAALVDLTVSGATTATILHTPQVTMTGAQYPPQIHGLPAHADLVTVTAGGNDLQFAASMLFEAWSATDPRSPIVTMMAPQFPDGIPVPTSSTVEAMAQGLVDIVHAVRSRAVDARVMLVDYLTVVADATTTNEEWPLSAEQTASFRAIQNGIAQSYRIAAGRAEVEVLRASELSLDHGLGSVEPWVFGFQPALETTAWSFHPNERGMAAVADALAEVLGREG